MILNLIFLYLIAGLFMYAYCVVKSYEILGFWDFNIDAEHIGVCKYPKWLLYWVYWVVKKAKGDN